MEYLPVLGTLFVLMIAVLIVGNLWFHLIDGLLERFRRIFFPPKPTNWHIRSDDDENSP